MSFRDIKWIYYMLPPRSCFTSDKSYYDYVAGMKCEECGADLDEGDVIGLIPHIKPVGDSTIVIDARITHRSCYEKRRH